VRRLVRGAGLRGQRRPRRLYPPAASPRLPAAVRPAAQRAAGTRIAHAETLGEGLGGGALLPQGDVPPRLHRAGAPAPEALPAPPPPDAHRRAVARDQPDRLARARRSAGPRPPRRRLRGMAAHRGAGGPQISAWRAGCATGVAAPFRPAFPAL